MTNDVDSTRERTVLLVGRTRAEATIVFGTEFVAFAATTYDDFEADLEERTPGFVGVSAGPGMIETVRRVLELRVGSPNAEIAVEVPSDLADARTLQEIVTGATVPEPHIRRFRDRACLVIPAGEAQSRPAAAVVNSLVEAATTAPESRTSRQEQSSADWERATMDARASRLRKQNDELRRRIRSLSSQLREAQDQRSKKSGRGPAHEPGTKKAPAKERVAPPPARRSRPKQFLLAASGVLGARGRRGRLITLALLALGALALVVGLPVVFGLIGGTTSALVGLAAGLVLSAVVLLAIVLLEVVRRLRGAVDDVAARSTRARAAEDQRAFTRFDKLRTRLADVEQRLVDQEAALATVPRTQPATKARLERTTGNVSRQLQATMNLFSMVPVSAPVPAMGLWTASPDLIAELVDALVRQRPKVAIEAGSGVSTVFMALAAKQHDIDCRIIALEHDRGWAEKTRALLERHGVADRAEVRDAPLARTSLPGHTTPWYDEAALDDLSEIGLVLVDGPPATTGPAPRFPMIPLLADKFSPTCTILVDDLIREHDREVVDMWRDYLPDFEFETLPLQKGAGLLRRTGR